jgi:hypothetical protein
VSGAVTGPIDWPDDELLFEILVITENLREVNANSAYAKRCRPLLRMYKTEATRRGLTP